MSWKLEEYFKERETIEGEVINNLEWVFHFKLREEWRRAELER